MLKAWGIQKEFTSRVRPSRALAAEGPGRRDFLPRRRARKEFESWAMTASPPTGGISPVVVHNGLIYVAGQGANENQSEATLDITVHVQRAMDNVKNWWKLLAETWTTF